MTQLRSNCNYANIFFAGVIGIDLEGTDCDGSGSLGVSDRNGNGELEGRMTGNSSDSSDLQAGPIIHSNHGCELMACYQYANKVSAGVKVGIGHELVSDCRGIGIPTQRDGNVY